MISGKRSSRCSRKDLTGICACPLRGVKDNIGEEKRMTSNGFEWFRVGRANVHCPVLRASALLLEREFFFL